MSDVPRRVVGLAAARARHGDLLDRLIPWLWVGDPLADDVIAAFDQRGPAAWRWLDRALADGIEAVPDAPDALRALFASLDRVPVWVDRDRVARAGRLLFRAGPLGGIVLGARSLVAGYCAPAGNKPLVLTGRLAGPGQAQRLAETGAFVAAVCAPGGLERRGRGFALTVRVRLMHARVRSLARVHPSWDREGWAEPLNQHDLLATSLLFSQVFVDGLRAFGLQIPRDEAEDWLHLWRWTSALLGVDDGLLPTTEPEAARLSELIRDTQGPPDDDARRLVAGVLGDAARRPGGIWLAQGLCRALLGDPLADALELPRTPARHAVRAAAALVRPMEALRARSRRLEDHLVSRGRSWWEESIRFSSGGRPLTFEPPARLRS